MVEANGVTVCIVAHLPTAIRLAAPWQVVARIVDIRTAQTMKWGSQRRSGAAVKSIPTDPHRNRRIFHVMASGEAYVQHHTGQRCGYAGRWWANNSASHILVMSSGLLIHQKLLDSLADDRATNLSA